jgi:AmmeMemoRadiSam system protein B
MDALRPAAVAGMFYPGSPASLAGDVRRLLAEASCTGARLPKALVVPHAGYVYSGGVAAAAYARLARQAQAIRRVVLLGPAHRVAVRGLAVPDAAAFATPLGAVEVDRDAIRAVLALPQVRISAAAHAAEHSLEVQLPFLQALLDDFRIVPLVVGGGSAERILALDPVLDHEQACGATPLNGLLVCARRRGLVPELLDLRNSGDTAGDRARVVGYASFAFAEAH